MLSCCINIDCQLYASIKEWETGTHKAANFSTDTFLDVYNGHVETFRHIFVNKNRKFHRMMGDIYAQAR